MREHVSGVLQGRRWWGHVLGKSRSSANRPRAIPRATVKQREMTPAGEFKTEEKRGPISHFCPLLVALLVSDLRIHCHMQGQEESPMSSSSVHMVLSYLVVDPLRVTFWTWSEVGVQPRLRGDFSCSRPIFGRLVFPR